MFIYQAVRGIQEMRVENWQLLPFYKEKNTTCLSAKLKWLMDCVGMSQAKWNYEKCLEETALTLRPTKLIWMVSRVLHRTEPWKSKKIRSQRHFMN